MASIMLRSDQESFHGSSRFPQTQNCQALPQHQAQLMPAASFCTSMPHLTPSPPSFSLKLHRLSPVDHAPSSFLKPFPSFAAAPPTPPCLPPPAAPSHGPDGIGEKLEQKISNAHASSVGPHSDTFGQVAAWLRGVCTASLLPAGAHILHSPMKVVVRVLATALTFSPLGSLEKDAIRPPLRAAPKENHCVRGSISGLSLAFVGISRKISTSCRARPGEGSWRYIGSWSVADKIPVRDASPRC